MHSENRSTGELIWCRTKRFGRLRALPWRWYSLKMVSRPQWPNSWLTRGWPWKKSKFCRLASKSSLNWGLPSLAKTKCWESLCQCISQIFFTTPRARSLIGFICATSRQLKNGRQKDVPFSWWNTNSLAEQCKLARWSASMLPWCKRNTCSVKK